jgi:hypothetical protein
VNIRCPQCGNFIPARDIDLSNRLGKCEACNSVFPLDNVVANPIPMPYVERVSPSGNVQFIRPVQTIRIDSLGPSSVTVSDSPGTRIIQWRWFSARTILLTFFALFWDAFLALWYWIVFAGHAPWYAFVFPILHALVGVIVTYTALCGYFNSTKITLTRSELFVQHGPLPYGRGCRVSPRDIKQLYCDQTSGRNGQNPTTGLWVSLNAYMVDGTIVPLIKQCSPPRAKIVENKLEEKLNIRPQHVTGEYAG